MRRSQFRNSSNLHRVTQCPAPELRLVLLGRTGSGKSATGNTILDKKYFQSKLSMDSVTNQCQRETEVVQGRKLVVIDTPGWFDTSSQQNEVTEEVLRCLVMCSPGPHAFLLIIPIARFTVEQQQTVDMIKEVFEKISNYTIIIFTRADELEGETIEHFISQQDKRIQDVITKFGGRYLGFNNKNPENRDQVKQLLKKVDELLEQNNNCHFSDQKTEVVEKALAILEKKKQEKLKESIKKAKQEVRQMADECRANIIKNLEIEIEKIEKCWRDTMGLIVHLTAEINKEKENLYDDPHRLELFERSLERAKEQLQNLEKEKELKIKENEKEKRKLENWIKEEEQRREQEEIEKASNDDEGKWYSNETYFTVLKYIIIFLGGAGIGLIGPALFFATAAAPVGLAAELTALLGPELAAIVMAAVAKAGPLMGAAAKVVPVVTGLCSIQ